MNAEENSNYFFFMYKVMFEVCIFSDCTGGKDGPCNGHGKCEVSSLS